MTPSRGGHCIIDRTPTRDRGQSEVKRSRRNFEAGQAVKLGIGGSLRTVKVSPGDRWAWLMLDGQGSRPDFRCGQGVKHENLLGQDLDRGRGWKYRRLCSVPPLDLGASKATSVSFTLFRPMSVTGPNFLIWIESVDTVYYCMKPYKIKGFCSAINSILPTAVQYFPVANTKLLC